MSVQSFKKMALVGVLLVPGLLMAQEVSSWEASPAGAPAAAPVASESAPVASEPVAAEPAATVYTAKPRTAATASTAESSDMQMYRSMYESGASTQKMGRILSWGGMLLGTIGNLSGNATLSTVGSVGLIVGIPINGAGSSKMVDASNKINPRANVEHRGWVPYGLGVALTGVGIIQMMSAVSDYNNATSYEEQDEAEKDAVTALLVAMAGNVCMYVGWYKFSASADDASFAYNSIQVGVAPLLVPEKEGTGFAKGMQLTAAF